MSRAPDYLEGGAETFRERNRTYGNNYVSFGRVMKAMFPQGATLYTEDDWRRMGVLIQAASKMTRITANFQSGGHEDSTHDLMVYAAMLAEVECMGRDERAEAGAVVSGELEPAVADRCLDCASSVQTVGDTDHLLCRTKVARIADPQRTRCSGYTKATKAPDNSAEDYDLPHLMQPSFDDC